jgi:cell division protein FtsL
MKYIRKEEIRIKRNYTGWWLAGLCLVFVAVLFVFVWQKLCLADQLTRIEASEKYNRQLVARQKELDIQRQRLCSPGRLEEIAVSQLGLQYPEKSQLAVMIQPPRGHGDVTAAMILTEWFKPVISAWSQQ